MNYAFLVAGGISAFAMVWHLMIGRARPLAPPKSSDDQLMQLDAFFGRHAMTVILAVMALSFAQAARRTATHDLALALSVLALTLAGLRLALAFRVRAPRLDVAEWGLVALSGLAGVVGLQFRY